MVEPIIPENNPAKSDENARRGSSAQKISEILKYTNQLIRQGELDRAEGELSNAIHAAKQHFKKEPAAPLEQRPEQSDLLTSKIIEDLLSTIPKGADGKPSEQQTEQSDPPPPQPTENSAGEISEINHQKPLVLHHEHLDNIRIEYDYYREALVSVWHTGPLTVEEERQIQELRTALEISDIEHEVIEREAKIICYQKAVNQFLSTGSSSILGCKSLIEIQAAFQISEEESRNILSAGSTVGMDPTPPVGTQEVLYVSGEEDVQDQALSVKEPGLDDIPPFKNNDFQPPSILNPWYSNDFAPLTEALVNTEPRSLPLRLMNSDGLQKLALPDSQSEFLVFRAPSEYLTPMLNLCTRGFSIDKIKQDCIPVLRLGRLQKTNLYLACMEIDAHCNELKTFPCAVYFPADRRDEILKTIETSGHPVVVLLVPDYEKETSVSETPEAPLPYILKNIAAPLLRWDSIASTLAKTITLLSDISSGGKK